MASWSDVRKFALELPGTNEELRSEGLRAWLVNKKFFVWERPLRKSDLAALGKKLVEAWLARASKRAVKEFLEERG